MGTPEFAVPVLEAVHGGGHDVALVVTRPDARRGRGRRTAAPPVKRAALKLGFEVFQPGSINSTDGVARCRDCGADIGLVVAYGEILSREVLNSLPEGFLNLHASLLPKYRGAAPINWAIIRGETESGVTVQRMLPQLDAGPILAQKPVRIGPDETAGELHDRLSVLGAALVAEVLGVMDRGEPFEERAQDPALVTFAPKLTKPDGQVDWRRPAGEVRDLVRGLTPWPGAACTLHSEGRQDKVLLLHVEADPGAAQQADPGSVLAVGEQEGIVVQARPGAVIIRKVKPSSGRAMDVADYIHGRKVQAGDRLD